MSLFIRCNEVSKVISGLELKPSIMMQIKIKIHLLICGPCQRYYQQIQALNQSARSWIQNRMKKVSQGSMEEVDAIASRVIERMKDHSS